MAACLNSMSVGTNPGANPIRLFTNLGGVKLSAHFAYSRIKK